MGRGLSPVTWAGRSEGLVQSSRAPPHLPGPRLLLGTGAEILRGTAPSAPNGPWEVGKYCNEISEWRRQRLRWEKALG